MCGCFQLDANKEWTEKRLGNSRRALKHIVDVAFIIFVKHTVDCKPEQATDDLIEKFFCWVLRNRVSMNYHFGVRALTVVHLCEEEGFDVSVKP